MKISVEAFVICLTLNLFKCEAAYISTTETICPFQSFKPSCPPGTVIIINSALYGRMRIGKCINTDERPDCTSDVRGDLDHLCSGRTSCHVTVPHPDLHRRLACGDAMLSYLEVTYDCTPVITGSGNCEKEVKSQLVNQTSGHLSSAMVSQRGWGSKRCPWLLSATPGRGIQLTLIDFGGVYKPAQSIPAAASNVQGQGQLMTKNSSASRVAGRGRGGGGGGGGRGDNGSVLASTMMGEDQPLSTCRIYATVRERINHKFTETHICSTGSRDGVTSFSTTSNVVEVTLHVLTSSQASDTTAPQFLLRFEETGCANLAPPSADSHVHRSWSSQRSITRIRCNFSSVESELVCEGSEWKGDIKNCSAPDVSLSLKAGDKPFMTSVGVTISVLLGVLVGVLFGTVSLALVMLWNRYKRKQKLEKNLRESYATGGQMFQLGCEASMDDSVMVVAQERQPFVDIRDSTAHPHATICSNNFDSKFVGFKHDDSRRQYFDYATGGVVVDSKSPMPRSLSLGRNMVSNRVFAGIGPGTLPHVAMTPANQNVCLHCQTLAAANRPPQQLDLTSDLGDLATRRNTQVLKVHKSDNPDRQTSDWREANSNQYS